MVLNTSVTLFRIFRVMGDNLGELHFWGKMFMFHNAQFSDYVLRSFSVIPFSFHVHVSTTTSDNRMNRFMMSNSHDLFELFTNTHIHTVGLSLAWLSELQCALRQQLHV